MGKPTGFKEYDRELPVRRPVAERKKDFNEIYQPFPKDRLINQAARCMDCGVPTCHSGCPLGNLIPDWNDFIYRDRWREALDLLLQTNNFPEFTGRLCPAPCEEACVLAINEPAVTIEQIEKEIIEHAFEEGWIKPTPPKRRTGKTISVIGSGPAGLACAQQLNHAGHTVTVFERADRIGGLLRYGIPDFKLEKWVLDRRLDLMRQEGIQFKTGINVGVDRSAGNLADSDAVVICTGATIPRDLPIPGRDLKGVHFAMDFLTRQNRLTAGAEPAALDLPMISAKGKHVIVIGGGDTGSDCIGTSIRQQAKTVTNFELFPKPAAARTDDQPWPFWPVKLRTSSSHEEGCERQWGILTKAFVGDGDRVVKLTTVDVEYVTDGQGRTEMREVDDSVRQWPADLVLLAMGFTGPEPGAVVADCGLKLDDRGNIQTDRNYMSSVPGVFAAGDANRGQSLIVWAISEGREAARCVDAYLTGTTVLPSKGGGDLLRM
ncbi:glutamate synthase [Alkalispirochaeta odontotermitis]|nr:glutamate synthase [Alkalispirochaeta odontotermitis]CAB1076755.1 Glutamate synthase [NADPH] small chain (EC [Olavius algarvensis Delta 1 endosymbiont]